MKASRLSLTLPPLAAITILTIIAMFPGRAAAEHVIYQFAGPPGDGDSPHGGLVRGKQGELYGVTGGGGTYNNGTVFELIPPTVSGEAWTETVLYSFSDAPDGMDPNGPLIFDEDGNLYGTAEEGGQYSRGTVFELSPPAVSGGAWTETTIYTFSSKGDDKDGAYPDAGLVIGWEGSLYGTTSGGGAVASDGFTYGTVFRLTKSETGTWSEGVIHSFDFNGTDGAYPTSALIHDKAGNLYGTTGAGGPPPCQCGVVFELSPPAVPGEPWTETILHKFTGTGGDGAGPYAGLVSDSAGNLYGDTVGGGESNACSLGCGTVFELSPTTGGGWSESILYSFTGGSDGAVPEEGLVFDSAGNLYGTAIYGGGTKQCRSGCGTVFELSPPSTSGGAWNETTLHRFRTQPEGNNDGYYPYSNLVFGKYDALYGTTYEGASANYGTVFSIQP